MPPRRSADGYTSDSSQSQQDNEAVYVPMGQEDSIAEQAQRRSIASFLGMGDKKDRRRSSNAGEAAPDASTSKSGKGWWSSSRSVSAETEVPNPPSTSNRSATLQPRGKATLAPKPAAASDPALPAPQLSPAEPNGRDSAELPRTQDHLSNGGDAGHERPPSAWAAADAAQQQAGGEPASKQKHRRNRSLGSLGGILSLKSRGKDDKGKEQPTTPTGSYPSSPFIQSSGRSETAPVSTLVTAPLVTAPASSARLRTVDLRDSQKMSCFGMRSSSRSSGTRVTTEDEELSGDEKVAKPPRAEPATGPTVGMVGLKSIDNTTCFVSAAVQCLRHAAELPLLLVPTLEADMLAARAEQATSSSAPSAVPLAPAAPLGSSAPATPSGSPHSLQQAHPPAPQGQDSADVASVAQQRDSDPAGDSPQAPSTPQTSTPRSSAFSAPADSARPSTEGLEDRGSGPDAQLRHSGIAPLLPDDSPQTTPGRQGAAGSGPASGPPPIGPRPSIKVDSTLLSSYNRIVTEASLGSRSSMDLCRPLSDFSPDPKHADRPADNQRAEMPAAAPIGTPRPPSLLKLIAQGSRGPAVKGDLAKAVRNLVRELYCAPPNTAADVSELLQAFARLPAGQDFVDGNQHDCQEFLHNLIDALHEDLGTGRREPRHGSSELGDEAAKADRSWEEDAALSDSCVRELLRGQIQSSVVCSKCHVRSTTYEPFWDLSLPLAQPQNKNGSISSWFMLNKTLPASISDCLAAHTGDELLQGDEAFHCDTCAGATPATRTLRFHRLPRVLIMHLKRFGVGTRWNEKVATHITFPVKGLKLGAYMSDERAAAGEEPVYDLFAVSNHYGSPQGGHYTAFCKAPASAMPSTERDVAQWLSFNDEAVAKMNASNVGSSCAYMMFYIRRQ